MVGSIGRLKESVAKLEDQFEDYKIANIAAQIASGDEGAIILYKNSNFRGKSDTIIPAIVTLGYDCVLQDDKCLIKFIKFFSILDEDDVGLCYYILRHFTQSL